MKLFLCSHFSSVGSHAYLILDMEALKYARTVLWDMRPALRHL